MVADSWIQRYEGELVAVLSVVLAFGLIVAVDRVIARRGRAVRERMGLDQLDPRVDTRLRFVRRLVEAAIGVFGVAVALSQFTALDRLAASVLASGALAAAVIGFAARQTLANAVAGIMLAISQPVRIGDTVTFEGETGTVEDMRLTYTFLRTGADARLVVPNERLAAGVIRNDTIVSPAVATEVALWLPAHADLDAALAVLGEEAGEETSIRVAEMDPEGRVRLAVTGTAGAPEERVAREGELRAACLRRLRASGLLHDAAQAEDPAPSGRSPGRS
jgi:small-conductance mechanosensitive channel